MLKTLQDIPSDTRVCVVRADLNVPFGEDGSVADDTRLEAAKPTVNALRSRGLKVVLLSHFGRPKGQVVPEMSLVRIVPRLSHVLGTQVGFVATDWAVSDVSEISGFSDILREHDIVLMENTRFSVQETNNDPAFSKMLASLGDVFVGDAFSAAHRAHASTVGICAFLPSVAGLSMQREVTALSQALDAPKRPVAAIVGGAKVSTKMDLLLNLVKKVDHVIIGGGMANTFLLAQDVFVGSSLVEKDKVALAFDVLTAAERSGCQVHLPSDVVIADRFKAGANRREVRVEDIPEGWMILDIGSGSISAVIDVLSRCQTLLWNGPFGAFEIKPFDAGTHAVARAAVDLTRAGRLVSIAGGGDTVAALKGSGVHDGFSYLSTAGGAFLEWCEGKVLPGVQVLQS